MAKQCGKCDCLVLSDNSRPETNMFVKVKKTQERKLYGSDGDDEDSEGGVLLTPKCHDTVKIYVRGAQCAPEDDWSNKINTKVSEFSGEVPQKVDFPSKQSQEVNTENVKKKNLCFRLCCKKKNKTHSKENMEEKKSLKKEGDLKEKISSKKLICCETQTCPVVSNVVKQSSEMNLEDILKSCSNCPNCGKQPGGGCNTNTIIFPRDKSGGDGMTGLENWLRMEAKTNTRNLEDILAELFKQRRDIHELKDMLDTLLRGLREQLFMSTFGKGKSELFEDLRQKNLERKSNALSIAKSSDTNETPVEKKIVKKVATAPPPTPPPGDCDCDDKPRKRFFQWCK